MAKKKIGERLRRLRVDSGWSQNSVADKLGLAPSTISMYENNQREPELDVLDRIADLYGVSVNDIVEKTDANTPTADNRSDIALEFGFTISYNNASMKSLSVNLYFKGNRPILKIDGCSGNFADQYSKLSPEIKIRVCKEMMNKARQELLEE